MFFLLSLIYKFCNKFIKLGNLTLCDNTLLEMKIILAILLSVFCVLEGYTLNISNYKFHIMPETSYYGGIHSISKDSIG